MNYLYFQPRGGINDILSCIQKILPYCRAKNRTLLLDGLNSAYKINFSDYFNFPQLEIIYNSDLIKEICSNNRLTIYPDELNGRMPEVLSGKIKFKLPKDGIFHYEGIPLLLPQHPVPQNIIVHSKCGGGNGFNIFKTLSFNENIKNHCQEKYSLLNKPYLGIQVRNTDLKCNFKDLYENHKDLIHRYSQIYVATDDLNIIEFFKSKGLNIFYFTKHAPGKWNHNLHSSGINPDRKIKDLMCDIYIIVMSHKLLSNSKGGFIKLIRRCFRKRRKIKKKFE